VKLLTIDLEGCNSYKQAKALFEKKYLTAKVHQFEGNVSKMALMLNVERSNLYKKLVRHGIAVPKGYGFRKENEGISQF